MKPLRPVLVGMLIVALGIVGAACSDDDDPSETGSATSTATEQTADEGGGSGNSELAAFCDSFAEVTRAFEGEEPPPEAEGEALLTEVEETAPEALA